MSKILVVDDSPMMRDGTARLLGDRGYTVSTAENGKKAWSMLYAEQQDLIVLDFLTPQMCDLTFLRMLRAHHHWKDLPVLVRTGLDPDKAVVQEIRNFGVVDVIGNGNDIVDPLLHEIGVLFPQNPEATA